MLAPRDNHLDNAWGIAFQLLHGRLSLDDVAKQIAGASVPALQARVDGLLAQMTFLKEAENEGRVAALLKALAHDANGARRGFDTFARQIGNELAGIVFTAHPTFSLSAAANALALELMREGGAGGRGSGSGNASVTIHRDAQPTLQEELELSMAAIRALRAAIRRLLRVTVDVAAELYPREFVRLTPRLATVATWVGFDLDGRTDIGWSKSLSCRYQLALAGLEELRASLADLRARHSDVLEHAPVAEGCAMIDRGLAALTKCFEIGVEALGREAEDATRLGGLNRLALENRPVKQDAIGAIDSALIALLAADTPVAFQKDVVVLRAEWEGVGLGLARLHFRLNSVQLHNAIRPDIAMTAAPERSASRRHYLAEITRLLENVTPVNVHYGTVAREQTTAKRVFMLAAQFEKHFDGRTPIRLLIAESDTPFTLLVALYYARLFGVERHVEISPLFETAEGLHHGDRVIAEVLDNPQFLAYVRAHGRFCLQLGFSDSGRYIGQPAAALAIERFKLKLIRLWRSRGLGDVQLVFFDTHGESIGRGAHPRSLADRFLYTHSQETRQRLGELEAAHKHEVSFQGGEGYLWFASERTAFAVLADLVATRLAPKRSADDQLYAQSGWSLDFFLTLRDFQDRLTKHPGYLELIASIGRNLLYGTGSRAMQRQSAGGRGGTRMERISEMRAIPNNAILQQVAYLVNTCAGLGAASNQSPDTFLAVLERSDRLERILSLALTARERSDITMFEAYAQLMSPSNWLDRASQSLDRERNKVLRRVSQTLENVFAYDDVARFVRVLRQDAAALDDVLEQRHATGAWSSSDALTRLHTLRLALIQLIYVKAMEIPQFSPRTEVSLGTLVERLLHLDVPETVATLKKIFPAAAVADETEVYAERDTYVRTAPSGYALEHRQIFEPVERAYRLILELSALIALHVGAYG